MSCGCAAILQVVSERLQTLVRALQATGADLRAGCPVSFPAAPAFTAWSLPPHQCGNPCPRTLVLIHTPTHPASDPLFLPVPVFWVSRVPSGHFRAGAEQLEDSSRSVAAEQLENASECRSPELTLNTQKSKYLRAQFVANTGCRYTNTHI